MGGGIWDQQQGPVQDNYQAKRRELQASAAAPEQTGRVSRRSGGSGPLLVVQERQSCATTLQEQPPGEVFLSWASGTASSSSASGQ